jgi:hypothetical protein
MFSISTDSEQTTKSKKGRNCGLFCWLQGRAISIDPELQAEALGYTLFGTRD